MSQNAMKLSVDTGAITVEIDDHGEKLGEFRFNPSDLDIARRYEKVVEYLDSVELPEKAGPKEILEYTDKIKEQFDYLLNYKVSDAVFAKCNPLTPLENGKFYCEQVLEGIVRLIEQATNRRMRAKNAKIRKATAKYHK